MVRQNTVLYEATHTAFNNAFSEKRNPRNYKLGKFSIIEQQLCCVFLRACARVCLRLSARGRKDLRAARQLLQRGGVGRCCVFQRTVWYFVP